MTDRQRKTLISALIVALVSVLTVPLMKAAWESKVDTDEYLIHLERAAATDAEQTALLLDVLCTVKPADRRCAPQAWRVP